MNTEFEIFRKKAESHRPKPMRVAQLEAWQAATSSTAAKYQARVKELELFLADWCVGTDGCMVNGNLLSRKAKELLSTASPDKALQRVVLEARIDEHGKANEFLYSYAKRGDELRDELAALEGE